MCTIGYHKKLNIIFKNRDKSGNEREVFVINPAFLAVKTEGKDYYSAGVNAHSCAFVSAAVNTPEWTALAAAGRSKEAQARFEKENEGLISPMKTVSAHLNAVKNVDEWLETLLGAKAAFMGYNILLADKSKAVHVEVYKNKSHVNWLKDDTVITNHFRRLKHGPGKPSGYPSSFKRLEHAARELKNAVSIEDIFQMLKAPCGDPDAELWRKGAFSTLSSSVIDIESPTIYYSPDRKKGYSRIAASIPPRGAEKVFIEMSRYIDLPTYHNIERGHPFYVEMLEEIEKQIRANFAKRKKNAGKVKVLELGAGTGLCTLELIKIPGLEFNALEIDNECCKILSSHPEASKYNVILGDAVTHCVKNYYDLIISTFAHDHIHYDSRFVFAKNIYNNLKKGGLYIMGGELLPYFSNDDERKKSLFKYHNYIIDVALQHNRVQLAELENNALKSGLDKIGDFKRHEAMFEQEMASAGFKCVKKKKIGPLDRQDAGGIFVYVLMKK